MHRLPVYAAALIFLLAGLISSCRNKETVSVRLLKQAHETFRSNPKQALVLLDSIAYPENLEARQNALWCMLKGKIADTLHTDLPYSHQLERAARYYRRKGNASEKARILLYLGRAYVEDGNYEDAMHTYLKALESALAINDFNQAGYINSYMGDLYELKAMYPNAMKKYLQASDYFKKAGNRRSRAFAFRDAGRQAAFSDSLDLALQYMKQAETLMQAVGSLADRGDILNGIGNIFCMNGDYAKAKSYFKQVVTDHYPYCLPDFMALAKIHIRENRPDSALYYLRQVEKLNGNPEWAKYGKDIPIGIMETYALIEEKRHNYKQSLDYLKQYIALSDSVTFVRNQNDIIAVEKKYHQSRLAAENQHLRLARQRYFIGIILLLLTLSILITLYQWTLKRKALALSQKRHHIILLKNEMSSLKQILLNKENELENLSNLLEEQKKQNHFETTLQQTQAVYRQKLEEIESLNRQLDEKHQKMLQEAPIIKRVQKLAAQVVPNASKSPLSKKDWQMIYELVDTVYPHIAAYCQHAGLDEQEERLCYLSIFDLGTAGEAVLLNYTVGTVNKYRQNARRKLHINNRNLSLHEFLVNR